MANSGLNRALTEMRGTIDGFTYRMTPSGKLSVYGHNPSQKPPSEVQLSGRERFACGQHYSRHVLADPARRAVYQKLAKERKRPTNNLLVANFLNPPGIELVDVGEYTGAAGQRIRIVAFDD